jgi:ABC-type glycerol-3-phosphate transport system permease component
MAVVERRTARRTIARLLWYGGAGAGLLVIFVPVLWAIASSFRPLDEIFRYVSPFSLRAFIPEAPTLEAYRAIFAKGFGRALANSLYVTAVTIAVGIVINSMAGFVFAKLVFPLQRLVFVVVLLASMIPFEAIAIPLYSLVQGLNWLDSYTVLIVPGIANGLVVFLFRQFFSEIPTELIEAALIDGASWWRIYWRIFLPLSKPAIISGALILFLFQWNAFLWPLVAAPKRQYHLVQVAIANLQIEYQVLWNEQFAASFIAAVIPVAIVLCFQRHYIRGIAGTGLKG